MAVGMMLNTKAETDYILLQHISMKYKRCELEEGEGPSLPWRSESSERVGLGLEDTLQLCFAHLKKAGWDGLRLIVWG